MRQLVDYKLFSKKRFYQNRRNKILREIGDDIRGVVLRIPNITTSNLEFMLSSRYRLNPIERVAIYKLETGKSSYSVEVNDEEEWWYENTATFSFSGSRETLLAWHKPHPSQFGVGQFDDYGLIRRYPSAKRDREEIRKRAEDDCLLINLYLADQRDLLDWCNRQARHIVVTNVPFYAEHIELWRKEGHLNKELATRARHARLIANQKK